MGGDRSDRHQRPRLPHPQRESGVVRDHDGRVHLPRERVDQKARGEAHVGALLLAMGDRVGALARQPPVGREPLMNSNDILGGPRELQDRVVTLLAAGSEDL